MTRGKLLTLLLILGLVLLSVAFFRSCQGADGQIDETEGRPTSTSLRV